MDINQDRLWWDIQELGRIGRSPDGGITRLAFTPQDRQAQDWLEARMRDAGLAVREDAAGNLIGELCGSRPEKPCVMCGSHYDTVPGGGQFDGTLGILSALEAVRRIREQGTITERTIRLAAFKDEEGSRFGYGMVGSKSICGILDPEGLTSVDKDGISLEQDHTIFFQINLRSMYRCIFFYSGFCDLRDHQGAEPCQCSLFKEVSSGILHG